MRISYCTMFVTHKIAAGAEKPPSGACSGSTGSTRTASGKLENPCKATRNSNMQKETLALKLKPKQNPKNKVKTQKQSQSKDKPAQLSQKDKPTQLRQKDKPNKISQHSANPPCLQVTAMGFASDRHGGHLQHVKALGGSLR